MHATGLTRRNVYNVPFHIRLDESLGSGTGQAACYVTERNFACHRVLNKGRRSVYKRGAHRDHLAHPQQLSQSTAEPSSSCFLLSRSLSCPGRQSPELLRCRSTTTALFPSGWPSRTQKNQSRISQSKWILERHTLLVKTWAKAVRDDPTPHNSYA